MLLKRKGRLELYVSLDKLSKEEGLHYDPIVKYLWKYEVEQFNGQQDIAVSNPQTKGGFHKSNAKLNNYFKS